MQSQKNNVTRKPTKWLLTFVAVIVLAGIFAVSSYSKTENVEPAKTAEERILQEAEKSAGKILAKEVKNCRTNFRMFDMENSYFEITTPFAIERYLYSEQQIIGEEPEIQPIEWWTVPDRLNGIFEQVQEYANEFVIEYFDSQTAKELVAHINETEIRVGQVYDATFVYQNRTIWCNQDLLVHLPEEPDNVLMFGLIYEMVYVIVDYTLPEELKQKEDAYRISCFNGAMTELIAQAIYQYDIEGGCGFEDFRLYANLFLDVFQEQGLHAYFYGYSSLFDEGALTVDRFKAFCFLTDMLDTYIMEDGMSDREFYLKVTGLNIREMNSIARGLLTMPDFKVLERDFTTEVPL